MIKFVSVGGGVGPFGKNAFLPHHYGVGPMTGGGEETPYSKLMEDTFKQAESQLTKSGFKLGSESKKKIEVALTSMKEAEKKYITDMNTLVEFTKDVSMSGTIGQNQEIDTELMKKIEDSIKKINKEQRRLVHPLFKMLSVVSEPSYESERLGEFRKMVGENVKNKISSLLS